MTDKYFDDNFYVDDTALVESPTICVNDGRAFCRSISDDSKLEQISKMLKTQSSQDEKMFTELSELGKMQSDQVARTVAYSTNQVMKLHQDILNISNALMAVNNGSDCGCSTTTTTVSVLKMYTFVCSPVGHATVNKCVIA